jgi:hypothetical protein
VIRNKKPPRPASNPTRVKLIPDDRHLFRDRAMKRVFAVALLGAIGLPTTVVAQFSCTATVNPGFCTIPGRFVFKVGDVILLHLSSATTALTPPTGGDYKVGFNSTTGPLVTVSANAAWTLHIRASAPFWSATNTSGSVARTTKPAADLKWSKASSGPFTPLSTTDVTVTNGPAGGGFATTLYFQTVYNWLLDSPGSYSLSLLLTLTAP